MNILFEGLNSRLKMAAERFREISQSDDQREKNILKEIKQNLRDNNKLSNIHIITAPRGEESKIEAEKIIQRNNNLKFV